MAFSHEVVLIGIRKAIYPILTIILLAIFSYNVVAKSGAMETIKEFLSRLTSDRGVLVLLMVWGFGGLLEGMAGFGSAVAIPAAILIGLGFSPIFSALVALLGNTVSTGFGAVGTPILTLCSEIGINAPLSQNEITVVSAYVILQLAPMFILIPFIILQLTDSKHPLKNCLMSLWVGLISLVSQWASLIWFGPESPAIVGSIASIIAILLFDRLFIRVPSVSSTIDDVQPLSPILIIKAWSVYILTVLLIIVGSFAGLRNVAVMLLIGSLIGGLILGLSLLDLARILFQTLVELRFTIITILSLIVMATLMNQAGLTEVLAQQLALLSGSAYPALAPIVGTLGTFVTGSDTSSNILFGRLQVNMAHHLGLTESIHPLGITGSQADWLAAANNSGATAGKMLSPQSISVATGACGMKNSDDKLLTRALPYALLYIILTGLLSYIFC